MNIAPISIPIYKRRDKLIKCLDALRASDLAAHSLLYIFSDYPRPGDEVEVFALREYLRSIHGFKQVIIHEQKENKYIGNLIESIEQPLELHGKLIYLEEDLEVSSNFLTFMNEALEKYQNHTQVFSITGYTAPCCENDSSNVQASSIFTAWGCGFWLEKYNLVTRDLADAFPINKAINDPKIVFNFLKDIGISLYFEYQKRIKENTLTPDLQIGFYLWLHEILQIFPSKTMVKNQGLDGSGWNSPASKKFLDHQPLRTYPYTLHEMFDRESAKSNFLAIKRYHGLNALADLKAIAKLVPGVLATRRLFRW